jgi:hypothetical protein
MQVLRLEVAVDLRVQYKKSPNNCQGFIYENTYFNNRSFLVATKSPA